MISLLLKRAAAAAVWLSRPYRRAALDLFEIQAAAFYVRGVQTARKAARTGLLAVGLIALMGAGFVILPMGLAILIYGLSGSWVATGVALLILGGIYLIVPLWAYRRSMSARVWMGLFKADDIVARVTGKPRSE
jgi:hypothetical protein